MVCSNQVRENMDAGPYGQKYISSGGMAIKHYASLSLRFSKPDKMVEKKIISGKEVKRVIGVETTIEVFKSSVWKPLRTAPVTILFDYGIDDIRQNLQFVKEYTSSSVYALQGENISKSLDTAIKYIEDNKLEDPLRNQVIDLWEHVESQFDSNRKTKIR